MTSLRKWVTGLLISLTLFTAALVPVKAYGIDPELLAILTKIFDWMQKTMLDALNDIPKMINKNANDIFKQQTTWETMKANQGAVSSNMVPYETAVHQNSYQNAKSYVDYSYTSNSASGSDATKYPVPVIDKFNKKHDQLQSQQCNIDVPQAIGDDSNKCTNEQLTYTNTMLTSLNPIPVFPDITLKTAVGQQYTAERKAAVVRTALSQLALNEATDPQTTAFIKSMQTALQQPTPDQINAESSEAVARDNLILNQARAMLELRMYESSLMNERLLATLVAQNEDAHREYIRKLGAAQADNLKG